MRRWVWWLCFPVFLFAEQIAVAQNSVVKPDCGTAPVHLGNPTYLTSALGIVAAEVPPKWVLDESRKHPFYFFKDGENYESARTLIYINVERLEVPFRRAVQNDVNSFKSRCPPSSVRDGGKSDLLEKGCDTTTQLFTCDRKSKGHVDLVTKISIGGLLLNVVISADTMSEIEKYKKDYNFLLKRMALVTR